MGGFIRRLSYALLYYFSILNTKCHALECYSCQNIGTVHDCNVTVQCNPGESCFMNSDEPTSQGSKRIDMGCLENYKCGGANSGIIPVGKRQTTDCHECCTSGLCNSGLCSHLKPGACVDDENQDCGKLHSLFSIFNDIQHAKLICPKFCGLCNVVDGNWAQWSAWTSCDVTCDNGTRVRSRTCSDPAPAHGGADCFGKSNENMQCTKSLCPVHGSWSRWSMWGSCSVSCDFGIQRRDRTCSNPYPSRFGDHCYGDSRDDRICVQQPCANGGWSNWGNWSACTATCGSGIQTRSRTCTNPKPSNFGEYCIGDPLQIQTCNTNACPAAVSAFFVRNPTFHDINSKLTFSDRIYYLGGDFNASTGIFTCSIPGTYHFSVTFMRGAGESHTRCYLYKDNNRLVIISIDPDGAGENWESAVSQSIMTHLSKGEIVYLSGCDGRMSWTSSFSGFLLYSDT